LYRVAFIARHQQTSYRPTRQCQIGLDTASAPEHLGARPHSIGRIDVDYLMPADRAIAIDGMPHFFDVLPDEFDRAIASAWGWPSYRGDQVRDWVYRKLVADPQRMTNLAKIDRQGLAERVSFVTTQVTVRQSSSDGTQKLLLSWPDGANAETVTIPDADRRTACVSSQVGCPVGCAFCASGLNGLKGNLTAGQIVEQVYALNMVLQPADERINHIVFMGMGEPLANYTNVMRAIRILHDPKCFNLGARKITISTVGVPPKMRELAHEQLAINLAISLHAPNEALRRQLIPWAEHFALDDILDAARYYFDRTGREVTLEYILLGGVNDRPEHARQLVELCRRLRANVNLIRYNEVQPLPYRRPKAQEVVEFQSILRRGGVNAHVRKSRGRDIDAACGQLRRRELDRVTGRERQEQRVEIGTGDMRR
jgi:23S rRNA (adenine2503-C2)-methyltransferase